MVRNWTESQEAAISARGGSLLISAAAGSGKTAVLVERVIRKICDENAPTDLNRLLIVTYTKAAAAEMRERIGNAISERLRLDPQNSFLLRQQALLPRANISTIDSFCGSLAREYFYLLDVSADFRIADSGELSLLKSDALTRTLDRFYNSKDPDFYKLADAFSNSKNDYSLEKLILNIYEFLRSHPSSKKWINKMFINYAENDDAARTVWGKNIVDYTGNAVKYLTSLCEKNLSLAQSESKLAASLTDYLNLCAAMIKNIGEKINSDSGWDEIRSTILNCKLPRFPTISGYKDHPTKIIIHTNQKGTSETLKFLASLFKFDSAQVNEQMDKLYPIIKCIFNCVTDFADEFSEAKRQKNLADFSDLEHWALRLLVEETDDSYTLSELSSQIASRFDEVMVDEYQDTNEVQDTIFRALSSDNQHLFAVGDVKQSIYGFRQAMPEIFLERKKSSVPYDRNKNIFPASIILDKNFRSRKEITESINFIFKNIMSTEAGDMEYNEDEKLKAGAFYPPSVSCGVDFLLIDAEKCGEKNANTLEAAAIAEKILKMKTNGVLITDNGIERPIQFGDIAVLLRTPNGNAPEFVSVLNAYGIPVSCEKTENFFKIYEVRALLNLLRVISNPLLDIPLLATLMSPIYGFSSDDIANIRICSRSSSLFAAVISACENPNISCCNRAKQFINQISELRTYSVTLSIRELISIIFDITGFQSVIYAGRDNYTGEKNLDKFCEYAYEYEKNGRRGLSAFLNYMDRLSENGYALDGAADANHDDNNTVKIMSIHKSKGLEFPVCILANTAKNFNTSDIYQRVLIHSRMGIAAKIKDSKLSCYLPTLMHKSLALELKKDLCSEELRILYVAMTRAREKLIITAAVKNVEKAVMQAGSMIIDSQIPPFSVINSSNYCNWLLMCSLLHPDAHELRNLAQFKDYIIDEENIPRWNFEIITELSGKDDAVKAAELMPEITLNETQEDLLKELRRYAEFKYPLDPIVNLPSKVSASEIAHSKSRDIFKPHLSSPEFLKQKKITAAQKGTAVHKFLQLCDFKQAKKDINSEIERLISYGKLSPDEAYAVREKNPQAFFDSELAYEAMLSPKVFREYTFMVQIDAGLIDPKIKAPFDKRQVLMQGSVDLAYLRSDGTLAIADYKTDRISQIEELVDRYDIQLKLYKNAMEQSTEYKVSKCVLYSVYLGESIEV